MRTSKPKRAGRLAPLEQHWSVQDVARAYGVAELTVRRWIDAGRLATVKYLPVPSGDPDASGIMRFPDSALQKFDAICTGGYEAAAQFIAKK